MRYLFLLLLCIIPLVLQAETRNPEVPPTKPQKPQPKIQYDCVQTPSPDLKISQWFFGMRNKDSKGNYTYTSAKLIPFKVNQDVGFRVWIQSQKGLIHWKYKYELPVPLPGWSKILNDPTVKFSSDEKMAVLNGVIKGHTGILDEFWYFVPNDPLGFYRMTLYLDGFKACEFIFDVQKLGQ